MFLIHPRYASAAENALILGRLSRYLGDDQEAKALRAASAPIEGRSPLTPVIGFFRGQNGSLTILQTSTFSRFAYLLALRAFIRQRPAEMSVP